MSGSYGVLNQKYNTLLAEVLNGGGSSSSSSTLNEVLINGNTTASQSAIFGSSNNGTTISNSEVSVLSTTTDDYARLSTVQLKIENLGSGKSILIRNKKGAVEKPFIDIIETVLNTKSRLNEGSLTFTKNVTAIPTLVGISAVGTGLQLTTNGTLTLNGLGGSSGQFLKQNASGNAVWDTVVVAPTLTNVLTNGNSTSLTAVFQSGTSSTTIEGNRLGISNTILGIAKSIELDNSTGIAPNIQVTTSATGGVLNRNTLSSSALTFTFGTPPTLSTAGISQVGTGVQINTNGTLTLGGLGGSSGQFLKQNASGNAVWDTVVVSPTLTNVLTNGNSTSLSAIFNNGSGNINTLSSGGLGISTSGSGTNTTTSGSVSLANIITNKTIELDNTITTPHLRITQNTVNNHYCTLDHDSLLFKPAGAVNPVTGIQANISTNGLQLNTGGTLTLDGLGGSSGQYLKQNASGNAIWDALPAIPFYVAGQISAPSATTVVSQAFGYTFTSTAEPKVYLTFDGGTGSTSIVIVGLAGMVGSAGAWTGFNYLTSSAGGVGSKLNWLATN